MSIVLLVLKIIGITLLSILALAIVLLLLLLFCPFVYRVDGSYLENEKPYFNLRLSWLFRFINIVASYEDDFVFKIKILFITIYSNKKKKKVVIKKDLDNKYSADSVESMEAEHRIVKEEEFVVDDYFNYYGDNDSRESDSNNSEKMTDISSDNIDALSDSSDDDIYNYTDSYIPEKMYVNSEVIQFEGFDNEADANCMKEQLEQNNTEDKEDCEKNQYNQNADTDNDNNIKKSKIKKAYEAFIKDIKTLLIKIKEIINQIIDIIKNLRNKTEKSAESINNKIYDLRSKCDNLMKILNDETNINYMKFLIKQVKRLLNSVKPKKLDGFIHFGFEDPSTTGKCCGYISVIRGYINKKFKIVPYFNRSIFEINVKMKGHIFIYVLLDILIKVYFNKDRKRLSKMLESNE